MKGWARGSIHWRSLNKRVITGEIKREDGWVGIIQDYPYTLNPNTPKTIQWFPSDLIQYVEEEVKE